MADKTTGDLQAVPVGDLPLAPDIYDDTLIPVEQGGEAKHMTGAQWKDYGVAAAKNEADRAELAVSHYPKIQNGTWWVWDVEAETYVDTSVQAKGDPFAYEDFTAEQLAALKGDTGNGIKSIARTAGTGAAGTTDTYTITYTDGTKSTYTVYNGKDGETPKKGTDYWTPEDKQEIVDDVTDQVAPPIVQGVGGTVIAASDSAQRPLKGLRLFGKTTQDGTPSPDAPVELVSVGDKGTINTAACGKNLYSCGDQTFVRRIALSLEAPLPPGTYTVSGVAVSDDTDTRFCMIGFIGGAANGSIEYVVLQRGEWAAYTFTLYNVVTQLYLVAALSYTEAEGDTATFTNVQIELGSTATEYEPYVSGGTLTAQTPNGLPGFSVTSGGNYTDGNGRQWVCDEKDGTRGKNIQRIGQIRLDGSTAPADVLVRTNSVRVLYFGYENAITDSVLGRQWSNRLKVAAPYTKDEIGFAVARDNTGACILGLPLDAGSTKEEVQAWIAEHPIDIQYVLETPIETDLTAEELAAYAALHTNYPNTTVFNDEGAWMEMDYVADTKIYIDNKFAALSAAFLDN